MINLGNVELPLKAATKSFAILAKRGAGKSYTAGVMEEEFFKEHIPFVVFDPIDVHWGLRLMKDGRSKGLPVVVFGLLKNADIVLNDTMGKDIARAVLANNISCVISTFGMSKKGQRRLIADFAETLLQENKTPRHVFIEEAHEFVPQRVSGDMARCFSAVEALVVMGRNRGLGVTLINQRAATINKDVLTQIDTLLVFRNIAPHDRKALQEWIEAHGAEQDFNKFMKSLPSLPTGEGWIWSPEFLGMFKRIKIRERGTFHPDREKMSEEVSMPKLEIEDIENFIKNFRVTNKEDKPKAQFKNGGAMIFPSPADLDRDTKKRDTFFSVFGEEEKAHKKEVEKLQKRISELEGILGAVGNLVSKVQNNPDVLVGVDKATVSGDKSVLTMWLGKLPGGAARILKVLADSYPMKYTRSQLALATGIKVVTLTTNTNYLLTLKRNGMIIEKDHQISVNPELL